MKKKRPLVEEYSHPGNTRFCCVWVRYFPLSVELYLISGKIWSGIHDLRRWGLCLKNEFKIRRYF